MMLEKEYDEVKGRFTSSARRWNNARVFRHDPLEQASPPSIFLADIEVDFAFSPSVSHGKTLNLSLRSHSCEIEGEGQKNDEGWHAYPQ